MITIAASTLDASADEGVRRVALALLDDAESAHIRLADPDDAEGLHDFRVAVRRLRSWLRTHRPTLGRRATRRGLRLLRRVARGTNAGRDAEVLAAWLISAEVANDPDTAPAGAQVAAVLQGEGAPRIPDEAHAAFQDAASVLRERLATYRAERRVGEVVAVDGTTFAARSADAARRCLRQLQRRLARVHDSSDDTAIHQARLAGKRLRYALEPLAPHVTGGPAIIQQLKQLQDLLGDVHDAHVWRDVLGPRVPTEAWPMVEAKLEGRLEDRYARFREGWAGDWWTTFEGAVNRVAAGLDERRQAGVEIERKYLLFAIPPAMPPGDVLEIEQGYLPGTRLIERLRRTRGPRGERCLRTVKGGTGAARLEVEEETTREVFAAMWPLTQGRRVTKRRHLVPAGPVTWEVDAFTDRDLVLAEVEVPSVGFAVEIPAWLQAVLVREVTGEDEYVNANLAR